MQAMMVCLWQHMDTLQPEPFQQQIHCLFRNLKFQVSKSEYDESSLIY